MSNQGVEKMNYKKIILVVLAFIMLVTILIVFDNANNIVEYENYVAEDNDNNIVYTIKDESTSLNFRWINENVTEGPYRLFIGVDVRDKQIDNIYIDNLKITSSFESDYQFKSVMSEPLLIYNVDRKDSHLKYDKTKDSIRYYNFDDEFDFNFREKEKFTLYFNLRYQGKNINKEKDFEVYYEPYVEEVHVPIK